MMWQKRRCLPQSPVPRVHAERRQSPIDYLTEYRINEACKLLRAGNLSIAEVAVSVGFFDQFYFSRVFKRAKGVPPSKYFAAQADAPADGPDHQ